MQAGGRGERAELSGVHSEHSELLTRFATFAAELMWLGLVAAVAAPAPAPRPPAPSSPVSISGPCSCACHYAKLNGWQC